MLNRLFVVNNDSLEFHFDNISYNAIFFPFLISDSYREEVETLARELHCRLYRTSVKEDLNVSQVFQYLAEKYLSQLDALDDFCDEAPRSITIGTEIK